MPIYTFVCKACGDTMRLYCSISERDLPRTHGEAALIDADADLFDPEVLEADCPGELSRVGVDLTARTPGRWTA